MARRPVARAGSLILNFGYAAFSPLLAQSSVAIEVGAATPDDGHDALAVFETGVRFSSLKPHSLGPHVPSATVPQALTSGILLLAADLDAAYVVLLGERAYATPRAGISVIGGVGGGAAGGVPRPQLRTRCRRPARRATRATPGRRPLPVHPRLDCRCFDVLDRHRVGPVNDAVVGW